MKEGPREADRKGQRQELEGELRSALEREMYALNFLPVVDSVTGETTILEALLRWPDTIIGTQPTRKIVRVAERTGLIFPIGEWVLRRACEQLQSWRKAGHAHVPVAVNISAQELASDGPGRTFDSAGVGINFSEAGE